MIHSYDQDEVISTEEIVKHEDYCDTWHFPFCGNVAHWEKHERKCTCAPIHGRRIVIERWDDFVVKVKPE